MKKLWMECSKCKLDKALKYFSDDYDSKKPVCNICLWVEDIQEWIKIETIIEIKKDRKNKKNNYNSEFKEKSKILLSIARDWSWCSDCNSKEFLQVHHIDKNIKNNSDENLRVLCFYCHSKFHKHMQWKKPPIWLK